MQKITTHLWYDTQAKEAAEFYTSVFPDSKIKSSTVIHGTPSGDVDSLTIQVMDHEFAMISAGPLFKFNPSVSFAVACENAEQVDALWAKLIEGGQAMMELGSYPFAQHYGWLRDKYGLSWQLMFREGQPLMQRITPTMMFVGDVVGKAEEAINFYTSVFHDAKVNMIDHYPEGQDPDTAGTVRYGNFTLEGQSFAAMDSARMHDFAFNEAISYMVHCKDQAEIDYYWEKLSAVPESEQCGWLKDKYGFSWQIVPNAMGEMMEKGTPEQMERVTQAFLQMKKFDLAELQKAYDGQ